jgi:hypothetical protein
MKADQSPRPEDREYEEGASAVLPTPTLCTWMALGCARRIAGGIPSRLAARQLPPPPREGHISSMDKSVAIDESDSEIADSEATVSYRPLRIPTRLLIAHR